MKTLSWNCRGLGNTSAVRALSRLIRIENPSLVFLMETHLKANEMDRLRIKCGFSCGLAVDCAGQGRERSGLALFWSDSLDVDVQSYSLNHIHRRCGDEESGGGWDFTGIYGFPTKQHKW